VAYEPGVIRLVKLAPFCTPVTVTRSGQTNAGCKNNFHRVGSVMDQSPKLEPCPSFSVSYEYLPEDLGMDLRLAAARGAGIENLFQ
jgi:hypothetical protein